MKAARLYGYHDLRMEDVPLPEMAAHQVRIRIEACGICPSDMGRYVTPGSSGTPFIPGHEWVGEVVAVGSEVTNVRAGDRVAAHLQVACGMCENCQRGILNKCENRHGEIEGGFSEYGRVSAQGVLRIPPELGYEEASFVEPLACCINGTWRSNIRLGDDVVVLGVGPIGLLHVQLARLQGARVIATDLIAERLQMATKLGAHDVVNSAEVDPVEKVRELTNGRGADAVIVTAGVQAAIEQSLEMAAMHGNVNLFATGHPAARFPVESNWIHWNEIVLTGSNHFSPLTFQRALKLLQYGLVRTKPLISHRLPLEQTGEGFDIVAEQRGLKVIVFPLEAWPKSVTIGSLL